MLELVRTLETDEWRTKVPFSKDLHVTQEEMWKSDDDAHVSQLLQNWLAKYQPCLFGRIAAKTGRIHVCVVREKELEDHGAVVAKIQNARLAWKRAGWVGDAHGFIVLLLSKAIAESQPSAALQEIAATLAADLLSVEEVTFDEIYLDELYYEYPKQSVRRWNVGINYFCANGDGRWWNDHRIPGGMALSLNSVGHMAQSSAAKDLFSELAKQLQLNSSDESGSNVASLGDALKLAMQTISNASISTSGPATELLPREKDPRTSAIKCPIKLPNALADKSHCTYRGWYHTDVTIPSVYFRTDVDRPNGLTEHNLDFTYIYHDAVGNPDYRTTGQGLQIRGDEEITESIGEYTVEDRRKRFPLAGEGLTADEADERRAEIFR